MSQNLHDVLVLLLFLVAWSSLNYLVAMAFIRAVAFFGRKISSRSLTLKTACIWFVWASMIVSRLLPMFVVLRLHRPLDPEWVLLAVLSVAASAMPASLYVRRNMRVLYEARYAQRRCP